MSKTVLCGLDVGTSKVCCAIAEQSPESGVALTGLAWVPQRGVRDGYIVDLDSVTDAIAEAVTQAEAEAHVRVRQCLVSVSVPHIQSRRVRGLIPLADHGLEIRTRDIERVQSQAELAVVALDRAILHSIPLQFAVDGQLEVSDPVGLLGRQLAVELHLLTCPQLAVQNLTKAVQLAGLEVQQHVYSGVASAQALLTPTLREQTVLVLDIGAGLTDIIVMRQGHLLAATTLASGGDNLSRAVIQSHKVQPDEAETLKREAILSLAGSLTALLKRESQQLLRHLVTTTHAVLGELEAEAILLTGRTVLMDGFLELAEAAFGRPVQLGRVTLPPRYLGREPSLTAVTALGLIASAFQDASPARPSRDDARWPRRLLVKARELYEDYF